MNRRSWSGAVRAAAAAAACGAVLVVACGGGQMRLSLFSTDWEDDGGASMARVWQRLGHVAVPASADVVVGVAGRSDRIIGLPLAGKARWAVSHALDTRPIIAGNVVVGGGGGEVFALDATTGSVLWRRSTDGSTVLGAGDDGTLTVVTLRRPAGTGSVLLAVAHDGKLVREIETVRALGAPAAIARTAFVPWAGQYVSVIDLDSGDETARVTLRAETSRAWTEAAALWFGEVGFIRFDEHISDASRGRASTATLPMRELPGMPRLMAPGGAPVPASSTADDKTRIYARPAASGAGVAIEDSRWYATYFRVAMAFDIGQSAGGSKQGDAAGGLAWVHLHGSDLLGGAAAPGGIVLCDERGKVTALDASTGGVLSESDLGEPVNACVVSVDAQRLAGAPADVKPLAAQLAEVVLADDPQLVVAQRLLLRELSALNEEIATKALVDLASDPRTSPLLLADARTALANRRNGASFMEAALARHYDFLRDVLRAPPVGPIAQALGAMKERPAASLLASHLLDPADTDDDVMRAAAALAVVAGPTEVPLLRQFFGMYRASASDDDIAAAVVSVGQALVVADAPAGRALVEAAAADTSTVPYARERLGALISALDQTTGITGSSDAGAGGKKGK
jgi:outer membrane protein assembly factor BamB